jgi:hypothetical protein
MNSFSSPFKQTYYVFPKFSSELLQEEASGEGEGG